MAGRTRGEGRFAAEGLGAWLEIVPSGPLTGDLAAPPSKSVTNRLLVVASLAAGRSRLEGVLDSDDTAAMVTGLRSFGVRIEESRSAEPAAPAARRILSIEGTDGQLAAPAAVVDARLSGTTLRFLAALSLLAGGTTTLDGCPPLRKRPTAALIEALASLGAGVVSDGGFPPISVSSSGLQGGYLEVDAAASSQFVTALLLVAPYASSDSEIEVVNLGASGYVDLTVDVMRRFGARVVQIGARYQVSAAHRYVARDVVVEYDASSAAHLFALAMATGGSVRVTNARRHTLQPDARILDLFCEMGGQVTRAGDQLLLAGPQLPLPIEADLAAMPDQLATVAVLAALAEGRSALRGLAVARGHETDRVAAVSAELRRLGAGVCSGEDWLEVVGGGLHGGLVETYDDHRMAMAFTALAARVPGIRLRSPGCVAKTYPGFFEDAAMLGLGLRPAGA